MNPRKPERPVRRRPVATDSNQTELAFAPLQRTMVAAMHAATAGEFEPLQAVKTVAGQEAVPPPASEDLPMMPVRRLQNYAYCARLFYFQWVEDLFVENADTVKGSADHRQVDKPSALPEDPKELELPEGARLRSLQLESEALGLVGKIDVVEGTGNGMEVIDHKKGAARRGENGERSRRSMTRCRWRRTCFCCGKRVIR